MTEHDLHFIAVVALLVLAGLVLLSSRFTLAPYGRHGRTWWSGPDLPSWAAWMLMEIPQPVGFVICFVIGARHGVMAWVFVGMWLFHYTYRTFIYPFLPRASRMSLSVVLFGFVLNSLFSTLNGRWLFTLGPDRGVEWLVDPRFLAGALLFFGGWTLCTTSDRILRNLRAPGETGYKIPTAGAFRWVTSPNYLGEIVMWLGWSLATWSLAGFTIAAITMANLIPRARANHRWYHQKFPDYPKARKALVPYLF